MKPSFQGNGLPGRRDFCRTGRKTQSPVTDYSYQTFSLDRYHGGPIGNSRPSFLNISREYFGYEARRHFLSEVAFFLVIAAILAATFISGARAIIHFLNLPAA
jgi:hypothetical protein